MLRQALGSDIADIQRVRQSVRENRLVSTVVSDVDVEEADRQARRADPGVVGDAPVLERHVEVHADEHGRTLADREVAHRLLRERHGGFRAAGRRGRRSGSNIPTRCRTRRRS